MGKSCNEAARTLVDCLKKTECVKNGGNFKDCMKDENAGCSQYRTAYYLCKRGGLDMRTRIQGEKAYWGLRSRLLVTSVIVHMYNLFVRNFSAIIFVYIPMALKSSLWDLHHERWANRYSVRSNASLWMARPSCVHPEELLVQRLHRRKGQGVEEFIIMRGSRHLHGCEEAMMRFFAVLMSLHLR